jgi:hypothetical protein
MIVLLVSCAGIVKLYGKRCNCPNFLSIQKQDIIRSLTYDSFEAKLCLAQKLYGKRHNSPNFLSIQKQDSLDYSGSSAALVIPKERALQNKACSLRSHGLFHASCRSSTLGSGGHKKALRRWRKALFCGEGGIRTPGGVTLNGFQDRRIRPLCHFSVFGSANLAFLMSLQKQKKNIVIFSCVPTAH